MARYIRFYDGTNSINGILSEGSEKDAFIVCHGLAGSASDGEETLVSGDLEEMGYTTLRVSHITGRKNELLFGSQVRQLVEAVSFLSLDFPAARVHLLGISLGASNAIIAGAVDSRVSSVAAIAGIADGETWMRERHGEVYGEFIRQVES